jgi:hypothetical protein
VRKSLWIVGQLCTTTSLVSTVRFHGPFRYQKSFVGVASFGMPYFASICLATFFCAAGQASMMPLTSPASTVYRPPSSVSCSPFSL